MKNIILVVLFLFSNTASAQTTGAHNLQTLTDYDPAEFFPYHLGDRKNFYYEFFGADERYGINKTLIQDSIAVEGHYLFFDTDTIAQYIVDSLDIWENSLADGYEYPRPAFYRLVYKLDATKGDSWITHIDSVSEYKYQERALVVHDSTAQVLGYYTRIKEILYERQVIGDTTIPDFDRDDYAGPQSHTIALGVGRVHKALGADLPEHTLKFAVVDGDTINHKLNVNLENEIPRADFTLNQNYPNPFSGQTTISFAANQYQYIEISIFNILGQKVALLTEGDYPTGNYMVSFDASDLPAGVYFYYLKSGDQTITKAMTIFR